MHPEIKCHLHSFKMELNLALTRVGTLEINEVIQKINSLQNVQLGVGPCYDLFWRESEQKNRIKRGPFSKHRELIESSILIIATIKYSLFIIALTWTDHWCILMVTTVMHTPWLVLTIHNGIFISLTLNIVQPNLSTSLTKPCILWSTDSRRIPKLTTDNSRIFYIPGIVTNRSPATSVIDLHSALSRPASPNQSQTWWCVITKDFEKKRNCYLYACFFVLLFHYAGVLLFF